MNAWAIRIVAGVTGVLLSFPSIAAVVTLPTAYEEVGAEYGVPAPLLFAVARTESNAANVGLPWPWTLNIRGKAHYFETREDALRTLRTELAQGEERIAVGLMQVFWKYHGKAIGSAELALDPWFNLRYGAAYLRDLYDAHGDWNTAVACYHHCSASKPEIGDAYRSLVVKRLRQLVSK